MEYLQQAQEMVSEEEENDPVAALMKRLYAERTNDKLALQCAEARVAALEELITNHGRFCGDCYLCNKFKEFPKFYYCPLLDWSKDVRLDQQEAQCQDFKRKELKEEPHELQEEPA
jgi:hypothetical protein